MPAVRSRKRSRKASRKGKGQSHITKKQCNDYLKMKVAANIAEYKRGRYADRMQAIAVSYAQTKKKFPGCAKFFSLKK
jgi:hypothetical protein